MYVEQLGGGRGFVKACLLLPARRTSCRWLPPASSSGHAVACRGRSSGCTRGGHVAGEPAGLLGQLVGRGLGRRRDRPAAEEDSHSTFPLGAGGNRFIGDPGDDYHSRGSARQLRTPADSGRGTFRCQIVGFFPRSWEMRRSTDLRVRGWAILCPGPPKPSSRSSNCWPDRRPSPTSATT
jgi:hypothetical protein